MPRGPSRSVWPGLLLWLTPALALGQAASDPVAGAVQESRLEAESGSVRLRKGGQVVWETALTPHLAAGQAGPALRGPLPLEDRLVLCLGTQLYELSATDGRVLRRQPLPGPCTALEAIPAGLRLVASEGQGPPSGWRWERVLARPGQELPFYAFPSGGPGAVWARVQARLVPNLDPDAAVNQARLAAEPGLRTSLEAAIPRLQALAVQDPTNPWYHLTRAEYLALLGRAEEAAQATRQALGADPAYDFELTAMADALGRREPALGDEAHRRGLRFLLTHGYEPELSHLLLAHAVLLGRLREGAAPQRAELVARARRLLDLTPLSQGANGFYAALAASGTGEEAARFTALAEEARPYQVFGPEEPLVPRTGLWLQGLLACLLAVLAAGAIKAVRSLSTRFKPPVGALARWNPMARWSRGEQLGLIAVLGLGLWCGQHAAQGVALIGVQAAVPLNLLQGQLQHPAASAYLAGLPPRPGVVFLRAFGHQQAGELAEAVGLYQGLDTPAARTNLAILNIRQGDLARARQLLSQAREDDPELEEARLALAYLDRLEAKPAPSPAAAEPAPGGPGTAELAPAEPAAPVAAVVPPWPATGLARRLARLRTAGLEDEPLPVLPALADWGDVWRAALESTHRPELDDPIHATLAAVAATDLEGRAVSSFWETLLWLDLAIVALALLAFLNSFSRRELEPTRRSKLGWALGALLPGAACQYWLFGTAILAVFAFQVFGAWVLEMSQGVSSNLLGVLAAPDLSHAFGAHLAQADPLQAWLDAVCAHWWVLLPINVVFVAIAEKVAADPAGPFIRMRGMARATWRH